MKDTILITAELLDRLLDPRSDDEQSATIIDARQRFADRGARPQATGDTPVGQPGKVLAFRRKA